LEKLRQQIEAGGFAGPVGLRTRSCHGSATWVAARPRPRLPYISSSISAAALWTLASTAASGFAFQRSAGCGDLTIFMPDLSEAGSEPPPIPKLYQALGKQSRERGRRGRPARRFRSRPGKAPAASLPESNSDRGFTPSRPPPARAAGPPGARGRR